MALLDSVTPWMVDPGASPNSHERLQLPVGAGSSMSDLFVGKHSGLFLGHSPFEPISTKSTLLVILRPLVLENPTPNPYSRLRVLLRSTDTY